MVQLQGSPKKRRDVTLPMEAMNKYNSEQSSPVTAVERKAAICHLAL